MGFFGKLPSRGDFIRIGLSRLATTAWDRWLSSVLPDAPDASRLPPWRFAFWPGVCGPAALTGVLLPSHDRIGRLFPLLIAAEAAEPGEVFLDAAELIGTTAIRDAVAPNTLIRQLGRAPRPMPAGRTSGPPARWWRRGNTVTEFPGKALPDPDAFLRMLQP